MAPISSERIIQILQTTNEQQSAQIKEQADTIRQLRTLVEELQGTIANLEETVREFQRMLFGSISESSKKRSSQSKKKSDEGETEIVVSAHKRRSRSSKKELLKDVPIREVKIDVPEEERFCPDCHTALKHLGHKYVREELRIVPAKVLRIHYYQEKLYCPACKQEDDDTIIAASVPKPLLNPKLRLYLFPHFL